MLGGKDKGRGGAARRGLSVIGADVTVRGDVTTEGDLHVDGTIEGDVACGCLIQGAGGRIVGTVRVREARLAGGVEGEIHAATLVVEKSARLQGDAFYHAVSIETGARIDGRLNHVAATDEDEPALRLVGG